MGLLDIFKASAIKRENEKLNNLIAELGARDAIHIKAKIAEFESELGVLNKRKSDLENTISSLSDEIEGKRKEIIVIEEELLLEGFALYKPKFKFMSSDEYKARLEACRERQKTMIKDGHAVSASENWTVNNSKSEGKKMVSDMKKLLLRSFNNECDYCVDNVKFNNMESQEKRIEKSFEALCKLGRIMDARISEGYKKLKYEELHLAFEYQEKKQDEKEEQRAAREELREQQKLEQEIRQARERIEKEKKHYAQALKELEIRLTGNVSDAEKEMLVEKIAEIKAQCAELEKEEKVIDYRESNSKAGYVYVISNIGAFGENVYKIGMTRRLEPLDRINELGDASVPFSFDIHALVFSENAPALEAKVHSHFSKNRLNKINNRKEFFRADIYEIEKIIKENYDKVVDVMKEAPAEQYRESLLLG